MATRNLGTLTLDMVTRIGGFTRPMDEAERRARRNFKRMRDEASATSRAINSSMRNAAAAVAGAFSVREIVAATESWTTINNRLTLVTNSSMELAAAQKSLFDIAQRTRQPLSATAELYQRLATNAKALNLSAGELNTIVGTINKTLAISNTTGSAASAALVQLGQAFASNQLRGQELNSVLEQAPALAKAIADGMGVAVGDLKALAEAGVLTARQVSDALIQQAAAVDQQFKKITTTIGQALPTLGNSLTKIIGELDGMVGASAAVSGQIIQLSGYLDNNFTQVIENATRAAELFAIVVGSRVTGALLQKGAATAADYLATRQAAVASAEAATAKAREAATEADLAKARLLAANSAAVHAAKMVAGERQMQAARIDSLKGIAAQIAAERNLEKIRFAAQINDAGRAASTQRMAQARVEEVAVINQIAAAEARLAQTTVASNTAATAALAEKTAAEVAYTAAAGKAADASAIAAKQNNALTLSARASAVAVRGLNGAMALMGGPLGVAALAAGAIYYLATRTTELDRAMENVGISTRKTVEEFQKLDAAAQRTKMREHKDLLQDAQEEVEKLTLRHKELGDLLSRERALGLTGEEWNPFGSVASRFDETETALIKTRRLVSQLTGELAQFDGSAGFVRVTESVSALGDALQGASVNLMELDENIKKSVKDDFWGLVDSYEKMEAEARKLIESYGDISEEQKRLNEDLERAEALRANGIVDLANQLESAARKSFSEFIRNEDQEKLDELIKSFASLEDRLDPAEAALRKYKEGQQQLSRALDEGIISLSRYYELFASLDRELVENKIGKSLDDLIDKSGLFAIGGEKDVKHVENAYTKAAERVDSAFASAWQNIDKGFEGMCDGIVGGFKAMLAEMAHEALTRPIVLQIQNAGGTTGTNGNGSDGKGALGAVGVGGIYAAAALAVVAAVGVWNKKQDEKFIKMTAEYRQGTQSLGTILGEQNTKSQSIANLTDMLSKTAQDTLSVNYGMYKTLVDIRTGIAGVASGFAKTLIGQNNINVQQGSSTYGFDSTIRDIGDFSVDTMNTFGLQNLMGENEIINFVQGFMGTITTEISRAIYKKKVKVTDTGIGFLGQTLADILESGIVDAFAYADINTKKKVLGITTSNRNRRETEALDEILLGQFADVFGNAGKALDQAAEIFGLNFENYVDKLTVPAQSLSLKDLEGDALTQEIESFFSSTLDNWAGVLVDGTMVLEQFQQIGEGAFETVLRLASETASFSEYAKRLGLDFTALGLSAVNAVQDLAELSGGFDALASSVSTYADKFFTDAEKLAQVEAAIGGAFADLGLAVPQTRDQFRDLVEGLNLATAAGREQFATLMQLTGATDSYLSALEREQQAREEALRSSVGGAFDAFNRALEAQRSELEAASEQTINALQKDIDTAAQALSSNQQIAETLGTTLKNMQLQSAKNELMTRRAAQAQVITANAIARAGGPLPGVGQLDEALRVLAQPSENLYATFEDYARDFYTTSRNIKELQEAAGSQVSIDEQNLKALQDQLQQAQDFHDSQMEQLDTLLGYYQDQINVLDGIDTSVLSVADAVQKLTQALLNAGSTTVAQQPVIPTLSTEYEARKTAQTMAVANEKPSGKNRPGSALDVTEDQESELLTLVKDLSEKLDISQYAIAKNAEKISKMLQRWDGDGMPADRDGFAEQAAEILNEWNVSGLPEERV